MLLLLLISIGTVSTIEFKNDQVSDSIELNQNDENINIKINSDFSKTPQNNNIENEEKSFTDLSNEIKSAEDSLNLTENYKFNNNTDKDTGIVISKNNLSLTVKDLQLMEIINQEYLKLQEIIL
ncbi:hypothetical protein [uncultured Methanobrevibacter sp.]|uniref:hypothetical protein n=1 Tax=uncultured Methanobrevibacter sp. TaxID=253161 RepID=UPI0025F2BDFF|nr:hypothetical protein [uncultured Methanobrevibacter sp.]